MCYSIHVELAAHINVFIPVTSVALLTLAKKMGPALRQQQIVNTGSFATFLDTQAQSRVLFEDVATSA